MKAILGIALLIPTLLIPTLLMPTLLIPTLLIPTLAWAASDTPRSDAASSSAPSAAAPLSDTDRARRERGAKQVAALWRAEDGSAAEQKKFVAEQFAPTGAALDGMFDRFEQTFEQLRGHLLEISRAFRRHLDLDLGPVTSLDKLMGDFDPSAHLDDDLFASKIAFVALLNFPLTTLAERLADGEKWSRRQWAEVRLAQWFERRIPAAVQARRTAAESAAGLYIAEYNIMMHHLVDGATGARPFPRGMRLISHWNLRDELKADYALKDGLPKQRMIAAVMQHIVDQTIPKVVINNATVDWDPFTNKVTPSPPSEIEEGAPPAKSGMPVSIDAAREPDTRYRVLLDDFAAERAIDPYSPTTPTLIARRFEHDRELPEARFVQMMDEVLTSPLAPRIARLIEKRLGRKLEPFDVWYDGFRGRAKHPEAELDAMVRKRYPTAQAYKNDIPHLLEKLGFAPDRARFFASHIVVDPARGAGHALQAERRGDDPHLRTRIEAGGMNYKGYNIAVHEMGHNVEQICSLYLVDHTLLAGVPNNAFTEALAFVFQSRDLELLGLGKADAESERMHALTDYWQTFEIAGVALVDVAVWHWMYAHPKATPAELRAATVEIARSTWNKYYAPVLGVRDSLLLGIYSHMIDSFLYLPDYPVGHLIAAQIEEHMRTHGPLGKEFERMASFGNVTPDLWMKNATGEPVSPKALLRTTEAALRQLRD